MHSKKICPVCHSLQTSEIEKLLNYPAIVFPVDKEITNAVDTKDLVINRCDECTHIFQSDIDLKFNEILYTKYYKYYPYSNIECFVEHYRQPFEKIFSSIILKDTKKLLEIGVSSAKQLSFFEQFGFDSLGITPQTTDEENIISSFYENYNFAQKFDVIISRFNLEHIVDIDLFMKKVYSDLNLSGLFIVQIPNSDYFMKANILNFYAHEHIHYFNKKSLQRLFENHDFSVEIFHNYESPSIIIVGRKVPNNATIFMQYLQSKMTIEHKIKTLFKNTQGKIILYGASLSLTKIIYSDYLRQIDLSKILLIDDNPLVHDKYMPQLNIKITPYISSTIQEDDIIILTLNEIYHQRIIKKIRADKIKNKIFSINNYGLQEIN